MIGLVAVAVFHSVDAKSIISGRLPAYKWIGPNPSNNFQFFLYSTPRNNQISGSTGYQFVVKDILYDHITAGTIDHEADITHSALPAGSVGTFSSDNPSVATVDSNGRITRVSDGLAKISFEAISPTGGYLKKQISYSVSRTSGESSNVFNSFVVGSLARSIYDNIDSRIAGLIPSDTTTKLFSTQDYDGASYVWNTSFWGYGVDYTAVVAGISFTDCCLPGDHERRAGVLVSPRHVAFADHFFKQNGVPTSGVTVRFIKQDGTIITRTITNYLQVGSTDIDIALLDSDVPAGISFVKVLSTDWASYLPSLVAPTASTSTIPVPSLNLLGGAYIYPDTDKQGYLREFAYISNSNTVFYNPTIAQRLAFIGRTYQNGDSSNPSFLIIENELVLLDTTTGPGGDGPFYADNISAINSTMDSLSPGGYHLTMKAISGFGFSTYP